MTSLLATALFDGSRGESAALLVAAGADPNWRFCGAATGVRGSDKRCTPTTGTTLAMFAAGCGLPVLERVTRLRSDTSKVDWEGRTAADYRRSSPITRCDGPSLW